MYEYPPPHPPSSGVAPLMVENLVCWDSLHDPERLDTEKMWNFQCGMAMQQGSMGFSRFNILLAQQEEGTTGALAGSSGLLRQQLQGIAADCVISLLKFVF